LLRARIGKVGFFNSQKAFHDACVQAGFGTTADTNGPHPAGVGVTPSNNLDGMRMSVALTYLQPMRYRLNLTEPGQC
jgi:choline dehydrogenase-like flavoprotein